MKKTYIFFVFVIVIFLTIAVITSSNLDFSRLGASIYDTAVDKIHFINVGDADSILIESNGKYGLVDTGGSSSHVENYLSQVLGTEKLKFVILTHIHGDHTGGMEKVIEQFVDKNTTFYVGEQREAADGTDKRYAFIEKFLAKEAKVVEFASKKESDGTYKNITNTKTNSNGKIKTATDEDGGGNVITLGNFKITILNRENDQQVVACKRTSMDDNRNSLIELVQHKPSGKKVLLTGDMEFDDEYRFLNGSKTASCNYSCCFKDDNCNATGEKNADTKQHNCLYAYGEARSDADRKAIKNIDILKLGHHGIYTSSSPEFLDYTNPKDVIITHAMEEDLYSTTLNYGSLKHLANNGANIYTASYGETKAHDFKSTSNPGRKAILVNFSSTNYLITSANGKTAPKFEIRDDPNNASGNWVKIKWYSGSTRSFLYFENTSKDITLKSWNDTLKYGGKTGCRYFNGKSGVLVRGWLQKARGDEGQYFYYLDPNNSSIRATGSGYPIGSKTYNFDKDTTCNMNHGYLIMKAGWLDTGDNIYYIENNKTKVPSSATKTKIGDYYYRLDTDHGQVLTGFRKIDDNYYYFQETGSAGTKGRMVTKSQTINNIYYSFASDGHVNNIATVPTADTHCSNKVYNGSAQTITKTAGTGYTFSNNKQTNVGTYTITATLNKYVWPNLTAGDKTIKCKITAKSVSGLTINTANQYYTGTALKPNPTVKDGSKTLVKGTDYTVSYSNNTKLGTATVTITGKGNYTGTKSGTFNIIDDPAKLLDKPTAATYCNKLTYNGSSQTLTKTTPTGYSFANNKQTNAGTYNVSTQLANGYKWKDGTTANITISCTIDKKSIKTSTIDIDDQIYTGAAITPEPVVKDGTKTLVKGTDYTVSYSNNIEVGIATVVITGKGNYKDSLTDGFEITEDTSKVTKPTAENNCKEVTYNGKEQIITKNAGSGYTYSNNNKTNVGTYDVVATLKDGYKWQDETTNSITITCSINPLDINTISMHINDQVYTGSSITPIPNINEPELSLEAGVDYDITYENNVEIGEANATITGKGNFTGTKVLTFNIADEVDEIYINDNTIMSLDNDKLITKITFDIKTINKSRFLSNLRTTGNWKLYDKDDNEITNDQAIITTGSKMKSKNREYVIVVIGDITKNGEVKILDVYQTYLLFKNKATDLDEYQIAAADYDRNGEINIIDLYNIYKKMKDN